MLARERRLTSRREFEAVYKRGKGFVDRLVVLRVLRRDESNISRFGFSTSPKMGTAVVRNRAKRQVREAVRLLLDDLKEAGFDAVLIARPPVRDASFAEIKASVEELLRKAGLVKGSQTRER